MLCCVIESVVLEGKYWKRRLESVTAEYRVVLCCVTEAVVLEGKYWKRRLESVTAEYKKWRRFYMERALYALTKEDRLCMEEVCHCQSELL